MNCPDIRPASTVIITSVTTKWPNKILLLKRNIHLAFLPGAHVFPGGRVDSTDKNLAEYITQDHDNFCRIANYLPDIPKQTMSRYLAAMIREALEESNICALKTDKSNYLSSQQIQSFYKKGTSTLLSKPNLDSIWPLSRWITPEGETRRYDTVFFLALIESKLINIPLFDTLGETIQSAWYYPQEALEKYEKKEIFLAPPTRAILERMNFSHNLQDFLQSRDNPIKPIRPYFIKNKKDQKFLVLPGDELHHEHNKSHFVLHTKYRFP